MKIGVYGLGRFGAFWAGCLADFATVKACSRNPERTVPAGVSKVSEEEVFSSDAVVLCNSISSMEGVAKRIAGLIKPGTVVMDTCSVKSYPLQVLADTLPDDVPILGTHPMFGPDSARNGLAGLPIVISPGRGGEHLVKEWSRFFSSMNLKVLNMTAEEHDREAAYSQGITHFIGRVLNELSLKESVMATAGYKALLEIIKQTCNDSWQLFLDIQRFNPYTEPMRDDLHKALQHMLGELDSISVEGVE